jgi:hypothetical protein
MDDYPISCFTAAFRTTLGGVLAFFLGLVGGSYIFLSPDITFLGTWAWLLTAWLVLIPYTIARLWGLLLVPILAVLHLAGVESRNYMLSRCDSSFDFLLHLRQTQSTDRSAFPDIVSSIDGHGCTRPCCVDSLGAVEMEIVRAHDRPHYSTETVTFRIT